MYPHINNQSSSDMVYRLASPAFNAFNGNDPGRTGFDSRYRNHDHSLFLFAFFVFCGMFVAFRKVPSHSCSSGVGDFFYTYCYYIHTYLRYLVLGSTYYIKSDNVDKEHGHTGGTYLIFPPSWPPLPTYLTIGMTETTSLVLTYPTLPYPAWYVGIHVCPRRALHCSARQADR